MNQRVSDDELSPKEEARVRREMRLQSKANFLAQLEIVFTFGLLAIALAAVKSCGFLN